MVDLPRPRRLYISGLPLDSTLDSLRLRLKQFGNVTALEGLGKLDGTNSARKYAFVELNCTDANLQRCKTTLSGTIWKGATLRIQDAKPDFRQRHEIEVDKVDVLSKSKRKRERKKSMAGVDGKEIAHAPLATAENVSGRKGWRKSVDKTDPIFIINMRPDHPLPPLPEERPAKKQKSSQDETVEPPYRARRQKIDPVQWQPSHLRAAALERESARVDTLRPSGRASPPFESNGTSSLTTPFDDDAKSASSAQEPSLTLEDLGAGSDDLQEEHTINTTVADAVIAALGLADSFPGSRHSSVGYAPAPGLAETSSLSESHTPERPVNRKPRLVPASIDTAASKSSFQPAPRYEPASIEESSSSSDDENDRVYGSAKAAAGKSDAKFRSLFADDAQPNHDGAGLFGGLLDGLDLDEEILKVETSVAAPSLPTTAGNIKPSEASSAFQRKISEMPLLFSAKDATSTVRRFRLHGTVEDYIRRHESKRAELTGQVKKRHREAKKRNKGRVRDV